MSIKKTSNYNKFLNFYGDLIHQSRANTFLNVVSLCEQNNNGDLILPKKEFKKIQKSIGFDDFINLPKEKKKNYFDLIENNLAIIHKYFKESKLWNSIEKLQRRDEENPIKIKISKVSSGIFRYDLEYKGQKRYFIFYPYQDEFNLFKVSFSSITTYGANKFYKILKQSFKIK